jgi:hypothetical protein
MGENQMGPKVVGRYCKKGENLKYKWLVGTVKRVETEISKSW